MIFEIISIPEILSGVNLHIFCIFSICQCLWKARGEGDWEMVGIGQEGCQLGRIALSSFFFFNVEQFCHNIAFLFIYFFIYVFIFGCFVSFLLCTGCLQLQRVGDTLPCGAWASHCSCFSCCGEWALERRLSSCGTRAQLLHGMWDLPGPGLEPMSPALAGGLLTTALPGYLYLYLYLYIFVYI